MNAGLPSSVVFHAALIAFGLLTLSAPKSFDTGDVESFSVAIVPIEEVPQVQKGEREAPVNDRPAPTPTTRPDVVPDAQETGDAAVDTETPPAPEEKPRPVETAAAPPPAPKPVERPQEQEVPKVAEEPKPVPATEVAPLPTPKEEVKPEPVQEPEPKPVPVEAPEPEPKPAEEKVASIQPEPEVRPDAIAEAIAVEQPVAESLSLPNSAPAPAARPRPAQAETAKAPERKDSEKPVKEAASKPKSDEKQFDADEVAALLNQEKSAGGGAKRSTQVASLGGKKETGASKLSQGEMDALRGQLESCWTIDPSLENPEALKVSVRFNLDANGKLDGAPSVIQSSGNSSFDRSAVRAVQKCDVRGLTVPAGKHETWAEVVVNFDPSEMF